MVMKTQHLIMDTWQEVLSSSCKRKLRALIMENKEKNNLTEMDKSSAYFF